MGDWMLRPVGLIPQKIKEETASKACSANSELSITLMIQDMIIKAVAAALPYTDHVPNQQRIDQEATHDESVKDVRCCNIQGSNFEEVLQHIRKALTFSESGLGDEREDFFQLYHQKEAKKLSLHSTIENFE
ncbi:hypothetical protein NDU88_004669 [Pleurodeles waltl]|uniref:Uncharacterized protein n=1 Tax=Pleurodeles waltl TaxID=8319 RepID=A0AAV7QDD1_PLEWA|nr:hypothetical protein NDU88_004669 [Pleurodeles waltl]